MLRSKKIGKSADAKSHQTPSSSATIIPLFPTGRGLLLPRRNAGPDPVFRAFMLAAIPSLRAFATSLSGSVDRADDLVQETLIKAWANATSYAAGTNMTAWLFTILRNAFYSDLRKRRHEAEDPDGRHSESLTVAPGQPDHLELLELRKALQRLRPEQREALILVGAAGYSYEEAAQIGGWAVGTVKSRAHRARRRLQDILLARPAGVPSAAGLTVEMPPS